MNCCVFALAVWLGNEAVSVDSHTCLCGHDWLGISHPVTCFSEEIHVKYPLSLIEYNQNLNLLTNLSKTFQFQIV
jgi:hypothetical protein